MKLFYPVTIILFTFFVFNTFYHHFNPKSANSKRLACHQEVTIFERLYEPKQIAKVKEYLKDQDFKLKLHIAKSHYMPTRIDEYLTIDQLQKLVEGAIGRAQGEKLFVDLLLYENDKADPKKKSPKAKLYEGYIQFSFYLENKRIYTVQIDYMDRMGVDITKRIECALESLYSL
ncbi:MAG: hypothetical protein U9N49_09280 [Campylobacterota bacterium]|nr:hypothetical protein [Campylobacterota bacterium]